MVFKHHIVINHSKKTRFYIQFYIYIAKRSDSIWLESKNVKLTEVALLRDDTVGKIMQILKNCHYFKEQLLYSYMCTHLYLTVDMIVDDTQILYEHNFICLKFIIVKIFTVCNELTPLFLRRVGVSFAGNRTTLCKA